MESLYTNTFKCFYCEVTLFRSYDSNNDLNYADAKGQSWDPEAGLIGHRHWPSEWMCDHCGEWFPVDLGNTCSCGAKVEAENNFCDDGRSA